MTKTATTQTFDDAMAGALRRLNPELREALTEGLGVSVARLDVEYRGVVTQFLSVAVEGQVVRMTLSQWAEVKRLAAAELAGERHRVGV